MVWCEWCGERPATQSVMSWTPFQGKEVYDKCRECGPRDDGATLLRCWTVVPWIMSAVERASYLRDLRVEQGAESGGRA